MTPLRSHAFKLLALLAVSLLALQVFFALRIAAMAVIDPQSTAFQRSEAWRLLATHGQIAWAQEWRDAEQLGRQMPRAVIASEDGEFASHGGLDWEALEEAWSKNQRAEARAERAMQRQSPNGPKREIKAKVVGGSTITQQLAKNLLLSGERTLPRKAQEAVLTLMLEAFLSKPRILEIYLNNVEWGEGLFGAQAAARFYFRRDAAQLSPEQAARLAVMLPAPKRFEKNPASPYVLGRAATISARMGGVAWPP
jgi:monofunctional glycosyltransferase